MPKFKRENHTNVLCGLADGEGPDVVIPETRPDNGGDVTKIMKGAFKNCGSIGSVFVPGSITSIGEDAFLGCVGIREVRINDLGAWAATKFGNLRSNPLSYGCSLRLGGDVVRNLGIPDGTTGIGAYAFAGSSIESVVIPASVVKIGEGAFEGCRSLTTVTFNGDILKSVYSTAFCGCSNLTHIIIGAGVNAIGDSAFDGCRTLTNIEGMDGVKSIGKCAFRNCAQLNAVPIPAGITKIPDGVFDSTSVTTARIPDGVTSIGKCAFRNCPLSQIDIPGSVKTIGDRAFEGCHPADDAASVIKISDGHLKTIGNFAFRDCPMMRITIPGSVTDIGIGAFQGCNRLQRICGMRGVQYIGYRAFYNDTGRGVLSIRGRDYLKGMRADLSDAGYIDESAFDGWYTWDGRKIRLGRCNYPSDGFKKNDGREAEKSEEIDVSQEIDRFMRVYKDDDESRYRSYDRTHEKFRRRCKRICFGRTHRELPLYLNMYLASWGMLRGSSFLLYKDCDFLRPICKIVCEKKYAWLMDADLFGKTDAEGGPDHMVLRKYIHDVLELRDRITYCFEDRAYYYKPDSVEEQIDGVTDTQVSKILLVTLGCIPAYDTYVVKALRKLGVKNPALTGDKLADMLKLAWKMHEPVKEKMAEYADTVGTCYSFMKYVDMALWGYGFFLGGEDADADVW